MNYTNKIKLLIVFITMVSCSSMEGDAEKMADLQCESIKMAMGGAMNAMGSGKADVESMKKHGEKVQKFAEKMKKKYESYEERQQFQALVMEKSLNNCSN
ncbi:hypothetical protein DKG77_07425 [Flagellimonas aquimarina]|uniref:Lipoprotein n=1 Tax=Flagellimonas aquimarina TaxID=2201895 RepID=A0A316KZ57_9FLAO|nr:hypothetical protein [Allomuricauda koreensis]PWL38115.1 hypothetical protein DKG77_07425 [Allomuricauda koreensis]